MSPVLRVEALETRDCPTGPTPSLTFTATITDGTNVLLSGTVADPHPETSVVYFSGVATGKVQPDSSGSYHLLTPASGLGTISAQAEDAQLLVSNAVQQTISSTYPSVTLSNAYGPNNTITLSGQVTDAESGGLTVTLGGAATGSVVTDSLGNFRYTTTQWNAGSVSAQTANPWGLKSNVASVTLTNAPPVIANFVVTQGTNGLWTFQGEVSDEYAPGDTVRLTGIPTFNNQPGGFMPVTVGSDGSFRVTVPLTPQDTGWVTAVAYDASGQASDPVHWCIT
jgi:hypothetical protein